MDPELDDVDGTYVCRVMRYPDGTENWLPDIKLGPNQALHAGIDPKIGNYLTFAPPSQAPPSLKSAMNLNPSINETHYEQMDTKYWVIGPDASKDRKVNFPFALVTGPDGDVRKIKEGRLSFNHGGSEVAPVTHKSTSCPSTSLPRPEPPPSYQRTAKVPSSAIEPKGARGKMRRFWGK